MKYIILCGGVYDKWKEPKQLTKIHGEPIVQRTIRLLMESGARDIAISSNDTRFEQFSVPVLHHNNPYHLKEGEDAKTPWLDAFYPMATPVCYIFGDVVFSPEAIKTIVETQTDSIQFFASAKPLPPIYPKRWAEPFAFKVEDTARFFEAIAKTKELEKKGAYWRQPVSWELWQTIKGTPPGKIIYNNYKVINDYTCDVDTPEDARLFERIIKDGTQ